MNLDKIKKEFIELKKREFQYLDQISKKDEKLDLKEKLTIYSKIRYYEKKSKEMLRKFLDIAINDRTYETMDDREILIEFTIENDCIKSLLAELSELNDVYKKLKIQNILKKISIGRDMKYRLDYRAICQIVYKNCRRYEDFGRLNLDEINWFLKNRKQDDINIYLFIYDGDFSEDNDSIGNPYYSVYKEVFEIENYFRIPTSEKGEFEKGNIIIKIGKYLKSEEVEEIFAEELLNTDNDTIEECIKNTEKKIKEINYLRSLEYREKIFLERINELYKKVTGKQIKQELLFSGKFLKVIKEIYKLPNNKIVDKEKVIKNNGKNSVIIIAITNDNQYIITFQNRIKNKIIAEFPSGYIEDKEDALEAAKRELIEETGYISDDLFVVDQAYTSPGTDNSISYIIIANNCKKINDVNQIGNELLEYDLFSEAELQYLINNNIMNGAMNKLAYYNLTYNTDCNISYTNNNKKYKRKRKKKLSSL